MVTESFRPFTSSDVFQLWESYPKQRIAWANLLQQGVVMTTYDLDQVVNFFKEKIINFLFKSHQSKNDRGPDFDFDFEEQVARICLRFSMQLSFDTEGQMLATEKSIEGILSLLCHSNSCLLSGKAPIIGTRPILSYSFHMGVLIEHPKFGIWQLSKMDSSTTST